MAGLESSTCRTHVGLTAMLALPCLGWGQVSLQPDTTTLQWGERVQLTANWLLTLEELNAGVADSAAWPAWADTTAGGLEVLAESDLDTLPSPVGAAGDVVLQKSWLVTSWDFGFVVVPPVAFGPHTTQPFMLEIVTPNLEPEAQPQPAQGIVVFEWTLWEQIVRNWPWWAGTLLVLALAFAAWTWRSRRNATLDEGASHSTDTTPARPPHEVALEALDRLIANKAWQRGEAKEVQAEASLVIRRYLEGQFNMRAAEKTTDEVVAMLGASRVPSGWHDRLARALAQADMVKFAKGELPDLTHLGTLEAYRAFVIETQPRHEDA
ncbi:MAG: hypothetical protein ACPG56_02975 [Flavobacteriales bacterium]